MWATPTDSGHGLASVARVVPDAARPTRGRGGPRARGSGGSSPSLLPPSATTRRTRRTTTEAVRRRGTRGVRARMRRWTRRARARRARRARCASRVSRARSRMRASAAWPTAFMRSKNSSVLAGTSATAYGPQVPAAVMSSRRAPRMTLRGSGAGCRTGGVTRASRCLSDYRCRGSQSPGCYPGPGALPLTGFQALALRVALYISPGAR